MKTNKTELLRRIAAQVRDIPDDELTTAEQNIVQMLRYHNYLAPVASNLNTVASDTATN